MAATSGPRTHVLLKIKVGARTRVIVFDTQDLTIGRSAENDISVDDPEMSRRHAVFKRSREGCTVEDMGTSNGTEVNGKPSARAVLQHGHVVKVGGVEITYAETTRAPSSLGTPVEYASQIKSFGTPMARMSGSGEATILGLADAPTLAEDDDFEVRPAGEFEFDLRAPATGKSAPRDLDAEVADLDLDADFSFGDAKTRSPAPKPKPAPRSAAAPARAQAPAPSARSDVWELDDAAAAPKPAAGPIALSLEIDGLSGDLRRAVEALVGKTIELPKLRVRIKGRDLG